MLQIDLLPRTLLLSALFGCLLLLSTLSDPAAAQLGRTDFPTSGKAEAQAPFLKGLLYLHSFEYEDARTAFREAQELDPDFAMAYWGEAMTHNQPIWMREYRDKAHEVLQRLAPTPEQRLEKAPTQREKAYFRAIETLFGEGEKIERDSRYVEAMQALATAYPDDLDAASFYSLAVLATSYDERDARIHMRAAAIAEEVFDKNPQHPGAAHYLIHSYDDPVHAPLGLRAARVYGDIAPDAVHALHMPSHIFLALGMWDETLSSNIASFRASERRRDRLGLPRHKHDYHSLSWIHYTLLQQGRYDEAKSRLEVFLADAVDFPEQLTHSAAAGQWATYVVETEAWDFPPPEVDLQHPSPSSLAAFFFAKGLVALKRDDLDAAKQNLSELASRLQDENPSTSEMHCAASFAPVDTGSLGIAHAELAALIALEEGAVDVAIAHLETATSLEEKLPFGSGPADPIKPSFELFGEVLLGQGRAEEARIQFEKALDRTPRRARSLAGLAAAARSLGDAETAESTERILAEIRKPK